MHRRPPTLVALALLSWLGTACISVHIGADEEFFQMRGLANVHASVNGLDDWDGSLLDIGILTNTRGRGELVSVEVGPLAGVGVGLVGARARVLPLEVGVGTLFYNPRPRRVVRIEPEEPRPTEPAEKAESNDDPGDPEALEPSAGEPEAVPAPVVRQAVVRREP